MHYKNINRRTLIRGIGGAAIGLPFLEMTHGKVWAQQGPIKRLVIYFNGQGNLVNKWRPSTPAGAPLPASLPPMLSALNAYVPKLLLLHPVDNVVADMMGGNAHNKAGRSILSCNVFTGGEGSPAAGPSIDQYMKQKLNVPSLELKVGGDGVGEYQMLFSAPGRAVSGESDPQRALARLFSTLPPSPGGATAPAAPTATERLRQKQKDILSLVKESFDDVRKELGNEDQKRLDAHAEHLNLLSQDMSKLPMAQANAKLTCTRPTLPGAGGHPITNRAQARIAAAAMACDQARIVTIQDTQYDSPRFDWAGVSLPQRWHLAVHDRNPIAQLEKGFAWYASAFKDILDAMNAIPEGNGTLLDNSLVVWITEYGDGAAHNTKGIPVVWAGGLGGAVKMNRFLDFAGGSSSTNPMFVTIMKLFGMQDNSFGVGSRASGTLPGIV